MPGNYVDSVLIKDERVEYRGHMSWVVLFWPFFFLLASIWIIYPLVLTVPWAIWSCLVWKGNEYAVTNMRVILKKGVISRYTFEIRLPKIEGISVDQGIMGRILNYGTLIIRGTGTASEPFNALENPMAFKRVVEESSYRARNN